MTASGVEMSGLGAPLFTTITMGTFASGVSVLAMTCPDANWTLKLNTGEHSAALGMSYVQFAMEGLRHQLSQGAAGWTVDPGDRFTFYKLADSVLPSTTDKDTHENDCGDGLGVHVLPGKIAPQDRTAASAGRRDHGQVSTLRDFRHGRAPRPIDASRYLRELRDYSEQT